MRSRAEAGDLRRSCADGRAAQAAGRLAGWLNDGVKGLLPDRVPPLEGTFTAPGIHVGVASAAYLFAMKALAARQETDGDDLRRLAEALTITNLDQALDLVEQFYGPGRLQPKTRFLLQDILAGGG